MRVIMKIRNGFVSNSSSSSFVVCIPDEIDFENWEQWGMPWDMKISLQTENILPNLIKVLTNKNKK